MNNEMAINQVKEQAEFYQMNLSSGKIISERQINKGKVTLKGKQIETQEPDMMTLPSTKLAPPEYNILSRMRKVFALNIYDALTMSEESRDTLIYALQNPQNFQLFFFCGY